MGHHEPVCDTETDNWEDRSCQKEGLADLGLELCQAFPIQGCGIAWIFLHWADIGRPMASGVQIGILQKEVDCLWWVCWCAGKIT